MNDTMKKEKETRRETLTVMYLTYMTRQKQRNKEVCY